MSNDTPRSPMMSHHRLAHLLATINMPPDVLAHIVVKSADPKRIIDMLEGKREIGMPTALLVLLISQRAVSPDAVVAAVATLRAQPSMDFEAFEPAAIGALTAYRDQYIPGHSLEKPMSVGEALTSMGLDADGMEIDPNTITSTSCIVRSPKPTRH